jgi:protein-S-isoprenylcysteine O-methyltransferase Ste14
MQVPHGPWWMGRRGEWYVAVQILLFVLVAVGPGTWRGWPPWLFPDSMLVSITGAILILAGASFFIGGVVTIGPSLTTLPFPGEQATLVESGPFRFVRHPIYCGLIFGAFGWALLVRGWLTILYAVALAVFFDIKARREERWLSEKFPGYAAYRTRVRKLVPFVY